MVRELRPPFEKPLIVGSGLPPRVRENSFLRPRLDSGVDPRGVAARRLLTARLGEDREVKLGSESDDQGRVETEAAPFVDENEYPIGQRRRIPSALPDLSHVSRQRSIIDLLLGVFIRSVVDS